MRAVARAARGLSFLEARYLKEKLGEVAPP